MLSDRRNIFNLDHGIMCTSIDMTSFIYIDIYIESQRGVNTNLTTSEIF